MQKWLGPEDRPFSVNYFVLKNPATVGWVGQGFDKVALKARDIQAQGGRARGSGLWNPGLQDEIAGKPCKGGTSSCLALTGLCLIPMPFPGLGALGFAIPRFQRSACFSLAGDAYHPVLRSINFGIEV